MYPLLQSVLAGTAVSSVTPVQNSIITASGSVIVGSKEDTTPKSNQEKYVAVIPIKNVIYKYSNYSATGTKRLQRDITYYLNDPKCAGIVLDMDSGGGQVSGTPEFYDFLKESNSVKPIKTYSDGYLCSAAYYIAAGTSSITVNKRAEKIGSIGLLTYSLDLTGYYEKQGVKVIKEYATESINKNKEADELLEGKPESYIKKELDPVMAIFKADIKASRPNVKDEVFTGSTYNAEDALKMGLIDSIGSLQDVVSSIFSNPKSNKNNTMSKSKTHAAVMAVLAVESLEMNDKGAYFNEDQLTSVEASLNDMQAKIYALTASEATAKTAQVTAETALAAANSTTASTIDTLLASIGQKAEGTLEEKVATLTTEVAVLAKKPGSAHTTPKGTNDPIKINAFVDANASHNQLADQLLNQ